MPFFGLKMQVCKIRKLRMQYMVCREGRPMVGLGEDKKKGLLLDAD